MGSDTGAINLEHLLFEDEVFSPELLDVGFNGATNWTEIVETSASPIDLKTLEEYKSTFD